MSNPSNLLFLCYLAENYQMFMRSFIVLFAAGWLFSCPAYAGSGFGNPESEINLHIGMHPDKPSYSSDRKGRALAFGYFQFDPAALNSYLDSASVHGSFQNNYMGVCFDNFSNNGKHLDMITSLGYIIPVTVNAGSGDSLALRMSGWHWTTSFLGFDVINGETVTLAIAPAISWGNLKMRRTDFGHKTKYTNPFVAPGGRVEFRLVLGNFAIGGRATYRYDITHALWKRKNDNMPVLPEYKNNGLAYYGYIGWIFD